MFEWASRDLVLTTVYRSGQTSTAPRMQSWGVFRSESCVVAAPEQTRPMWPSMDWWSLSSALVPQLTTALLSQEAVCGPTRRVLTSQTH